MLNVYKQIFKLNPLLRGPFSTTHMLRGGGHILSPPMYFFRSPPFIEIFLLFGALNPLLRGPFSTTQMRGGGANMPPLGKSISECLSPILFYTVNYTYIRSSNLKGFCPSFNTLDLVALQSSPSKSIYASNFRKSENIQRKICTEHFWRAVKN